MKTTARSSVSSHAFLGKFFKTTPYSWCVRVRSLAAVLPGRSASQSLNTRSVSGVGVGEAQQAEGDHGEVHGTRIMSCVVLVRLTSPGGGLVIFCMFRVAGAPLRRATLQVQASKDTMAKE
jgi:hypothetical protein